MSLIKCPECKRKVSDKAQFCPKCGFSMENYTPVENQIGDNALNNEDKKKKKQRLIKKIIIVCSSILIALIIILSVMGIGYAHWCEYVINSQIETESSNEYPLFTYSDILDVDPYGLSNENNIIGKQISTVLRGYVENEDYSVNESKDYVSYTFPLTNEDYPLGNGAADLVIYTFNGTINKIEYTFRISQYKGVSLRGKQSQAHRSITDYYDVDPIYTGYNYDDDEYVIMSKDEYGSLPYADYYDVTFITWESEKGTVIYSFTNLFEEKYEYGTITFTNDEIEKEEYQDFIKEYSDAI